MKNRLLLPSALLGTMLFALPAMAQIPGAPNAGGSWGLGTSTIYGGVWLDDGDVVGNLPLVTLDLDAAEMGTAVLATDPNGTFKFGNISITGSTEGDDDALMGFFFRGNRRAFRGEIIGKNIDVSSTNGMAIGMGFYDVANRGTIADGASVRVGNIKAYSAGTAGDSTGLQDAAGFVAGRIRDASVTIGSLDVFSNAQASGVALSQIEAGGLLTVKGLTKVVSGTKATGIEIMADRREGNGSVDGIISVGEMYVKGIGGARAWGINIEGGMLGAGSLVLNGGITAISGTGSAIGINVEGDAHITLGKNVEIEAATAGIRTDGDLWLDTAKFNLTTGSIDVAEGFYITGSGGSATLDTIDAGDFWAGVGNSDDFLYDLGNALTLTVNTLNAADDVRLSAYENGVLTANFGAVTVSDGDFTMSAQEGGKVIAQIDRLNVDGYFYLWTEDTGSNIDIALNMQQISVGNQGLSEIDGNVAIYAYGETTSYGDIIEFGDGVRGDVKLINKAIFTGYKFDGDKIVSYGLDKVNMHSEFLAAGMIHNRYTGYNMVRDKFISGGARYGSGFLGQSYCNPCDAVACNPCDEIVCNPCDPCGTSCGLSMSIARTAWGNYVGRADSYADWDLGSDGVQVGSDVFRTRNTQLGAIFGYERGWGKRNNTFTNGKINSDDTYVGLYAARVLRGGADVRFLYNHGWQKFDMTRDYFGDIYGSCFKGHTQEINMELGKRFHSGAWSFRPFGAVDFYLTHLNGVTELAVNGGAMPLTYGKLDMTQTFARAGFDLNFKRNRFGLNTGMFYAYELNSPKFETGVSSGRYSGTLRGSTMGREVVSFNVGGDYQLGPALSVFGGYDAQVVVDRSGGYQHIGYVGGAWRW